ncbi:MAG: hypothetical protein ABJJ44_07155 [Paraglaciecola sp.]|uniref:hypothetical protein n=1 Tax=Paraglaciecola sp. TaxID=1920173 RepID=UPI0032994A18
MKLFTAIEALLFIVSFTASSNELINNLQHCKQVENALERLVCFDKVSKNLPTTNQELKPIAGVEPPPPIKQQPKLKDENKQFGVEHKADTSDLPATISAVITSVKLGPYKKYVIQLDNGHIWKQTDDKRLKLSKGDNVIIKRGALNSFFIEKDGMNTRIRVKRAN